jgi:rubredoxin
MAGIAVHPATALDCAQMEEVKQLNPSFRGKSTREDTAFRAESRLKSFVCYGGDTRKARKDAMPHERGLLPVLPSEFACPVCADPKTRFNRSLASHSTLVNG